MDWGLKTAGVSSYIESGNDGAARRGPDNSNMRQTSMNIIVMSTIGCPLNYSIMYSPNQLVSLLISHFISIFTRQLAVQYKTVIPL